MAALNDLVRSFDIKDLADRLMGLTLAEAASLRVHLEEVHGIRPAAGIPTVKEPSKPEPPAPEPTTFAVVLQGLAHPEKKISVFKAVREITNLGLKETRELVEGAPATVKTSVPKDEAASMKKKLEDAGARVAVVPFAEG
jgi:large subunit ribosomal protein L7/L12